MSELLGAVITIAITLIAGAALFGYVNGEAANSENGLGAANAANVNFLNERFVVADIGFGSSGNSIGFWVYNNGQVGLQLSQVLLYDQAVSHSLYYNFTGGSGSCVPGLGPCPGTVACSYPATISPSAGSTMTPLAADGAPTLFTITLPAGCAFTLNTIYYVVLTGLYGNVVVNYACYSTTGCHS